MICKQDKNHMEKNDAEITFLIHFILQNSLDQHSHIILNNRNLISKELLRSLKLIL